MYALTWFRLRLLRVVAYHIWLSRNGKIAEQQEYQPGPSRLVPPQMFIVARRGSRDRPCFQVRLGTPNALAAARQPKYTDQISAGNCTCMVDGCGRWKFRPRHSFLFR